MSRSITGNAGCHCGGHGLGARCVLGVDSLRRVISVQARWSQIRYNKRLVPFTHVRGERRSCTKITSALHLSVTGYKGKVLKSLTYLDVEQHLAPHAHCLAW